MATHCTHLTEVSDVEPRTPQGCEECLRMHAEWVHLRLCLECGHVGCYVDELMIEPAPTARSSRSSA